MSSLLMNIAPVLAAIVASFLASLVFARLAIAEMWLPDKPNARSSHQKATTKAGGVAIGFGASIGIGLFSIVGAFDLAVNIVAIVIVGAVVALILGLLDDKLAPPPFAKLIMQIALAIGAVVLIGPFSTLSLPFIGDVALAPFIGAIISVFWIVGFMNAFNFMDGINGLAGGCAFVGLGFFAVAAFQGSAVGLATVSLICGASVLGFLKLNFARGSIFLGDNGSQFLSFVIAVLALAGAATQSVANIAFLPIVFLPIILDVAWTLIHRIRRGQPITQGHREHNYQLLIRLGQSHQRVASMYIGATFLFALVAIASLSSPVLAYLAAIMLSAGLGALALGIYRRASAAGLLPE